jgi:hypothetical protein
MYTAQSNAHGNVIVCKGCDARNSYKIVFTGSYNECMAYKFCIDPSRIIFTII